MHLHTADNFRVTLTSETNGNVRIQSTLPAVIPGVFSLVVKFIFNIAIVQQREIIHPSFKNTRIIDISIPENQLPQFKQFGISVALKFDDVMGQLTPETDKISEYFFYCVFNFLIFMSLIWNSPW